MLWLPRYIRSAQEIGRPRPTMWVPSRRPSSGVGPCDTVKSVAASPPTLELAKFPVLVVDDEQDNLDAFRFNFGKSFRLLFASSGEQALELARENDIAAVVTDQRMPRMTGLELLRAVRDARPDAVGIIVTAFTDVDVLIEAIDRKS